jgi:hypothetical protein
MPKRLASCLTPNLTSARSLAAGDECFRGMKVLDPEGGARVQRLQLRVASFGATIQHSPGERRGAFNRQSAVIAEQNWNANPHETQVSLPDEARKRHETVTCNALPALLLHLPWPCVVTKGVSNEVTSEVTSSARSRSRSR